MRVWLAQDDEISMIEAWKLVVNTRVLEEERLGFYSISGRELKRDFPKYELQNINIFRFSFFEFPPLNLFFRWCKTYIRESSCRLQV